MTTVVSVTEVRNALRCPRVFALGRARGQAVAFPVGASSLGAVFHRIVDAFSRQAADPSSALRSLPGGAPRDAVADALGRSLLGLAVAEIERHAQYRSMPAEVDDLAQALRELARYLARRLEEAAGPPAAALAEFMAGSELELEAALDGGAIVTGRIDALHAPRSGRLEVVEYKLTADTNEEVDRAQVALYRTLLAKSRGDDAAPIILRFNPVLTITRLAPENADRLVADTLEPLLCRMLEWAASPDSAPAPGRVDLCPACPMRRECTARYPAPLPIRDDPPAGAARPRPAPSGEPRPPEPEPLVVATEPDHGVEDDAEGDREGEMLRDRVLDLLRRQGVPVPTARPAQVGARIIQIEVSVVRGRVASLDRAAADLVHRLAVEDERRAQFCVREGRRIVAIERRAPRPVRLAALLRAHSAWLSQRPGRLVAGEAIDGTILAADLADPASCHLLVGGATGSGKSVLLRSIVTSLAQFHPPSHVRFTLVDPKRVTFAELAHGLAAHLASPLCHDAAETLSALEALVDEMEERYVLLEHARVQDVGELEDLGLGEPIARHIVVVDEFQDLVLDRSTREPFLTAVRRLGAKSRAAGIHLVLATQRPTRDAVPGAIKANLPGKVALRTTSSLESRVILDQSGAELLLGKGDLLADFGHGLVRAQAPR